MTLRMSLGGKERAICLVIVLGLAIAIVAPGVVMAAEPWEPPGGSSKYTVTAIVYEGSLSQGLMIEGALFEILELGKSAYTDETGYASISNVAVGLYTMRITALGYVINTRYDVGIPTWGEEGREVWRYFPMVPTDDTDGDGLTDAEESSLGTDPFASREWAVVVCGGVNDASQGNFESQCDEAAVTLHGRGLSDSEIYYTSLTTKKRDPDADGKNDVDALTTKASVQYAIETWMATNSDADDLTFVYFVDHGGVVPSTETAYFQIGSEVMYDYELKAWTDVVVCHNMTIVIDCCESGYWQDDLTDYSTRQDRVVITATDDIGIAYTYYDGTVFLSTWTMFSHPFFVEIAGGASIEDAWYVAKLYAYVNSPPRVPQISLMYDWDPASDVYL